MVVCESTGIALPDIRYDISHLIQRAHEAEGRVAHAYRGVTDSMAHAYREMSSPNPCPQCEMASSASGTLRESSESRTHAGGENEEGGFHVRGICGCVRSRQL